MSVPPVPDRSVMLGIVRHALRAPSMYNAQPWAWRVEPAALHLYADRERRIPVADPHDRNLVIGCGAALHHARVAAGARGWVARPALLPDPDDADLLATLSMHPGPVEQDPRLLPALLTRRTDRRRFSSWPMPVERVVHLAAAAASEGVTAIAIDDPERRHLIEELVARAARAAADDPRRAAEQRSWVEREGGTGIPLTTVPRLLPREESYRSRFGVGLLPHPDREADDGDHPDGLLLLTSSEDPVGWLRTGQALSAAWLLAEANGLSVVPLTQVAEIDGTRDVLGSEVRPGQAPQLLLRVGWLSPSRQRLAATPRRALDDVLRP